MAIESHVRSSHLGPRQIDEEISDHEEEFYYTEVEEEGDEEIADQQSTTLPPMAEVVESSVAQTQSFQQPNATGWMASSPPTLSHMDMARPPHEGQLLLLPDTRNNEREKIFLKNEPVVYLIRSRISTRIDEGETNRHSSTCPQHFMVFRLRIWLGKLLTTP